MVSLNHDIAVKHQFSFGWLARQLAPSDLAMQDDLVQEMSLAVLTHTGMVNYDYLLEWVKSRATDYLKYERRRGMLPLGAAAPVTDKREAAIASFDTYVEALVKEGVPAEWIEEALGAKLA